MAGCWSSSFPGSVWRCRPATCPPTTGRMRCWAFPDPEREVFDQVVLMAYRKADPTPRRPRPSGGCWSGRWESRSRCAPTPTRRSPRRPRRTVTSCFATRTVDPVAAAAEARRSGLWTSTEITDTLWPARDNRTRPLMPPSQGTHGDAGGGGLPRQPGAGGRGTGASWSRAGHRRRWCWWRTRRRRRSTASGSRPRWSPSTWATARSSEIAA